MPAHLAKGRGPVWRVRIAPHRVGRWEIPELKLDVYTSASNHARLEAVRVAHMRAGVALWRPYLRESYKFASAEQIVDSKPSPNLGEESHCNDRLDH